MNGTAASESAALDARLTPLCADAPTRARLARYGALLLERGRAVNLTGAKSAGEVFAHIADALSLVEFVEGSLVDVGSGGGLPGIPLAIVTHAKVTLVEATLKKARFLREALDACQASGDVVAERAEVAAHDPKLRERFDRATCRAVGSLPTALELTMPFLRVGGIALLQRGAVEEAERHAASEAALVLGAHLAGERKVAPGRIVLLFEKSAPTGQRFPRRSGIPAKRPLGTRPAA